MKRISLFMFALSMTVSFIACGPQKDSRTNLNRAGRGVGAGGTTANGGTVPTTTPGGGAVTGSGRALQWGQLDPNHTGGSVVWVGQSDTFNTHDIMRAFFSYGFLSDADHSEVGGTTSQVRDESFNMDCAANQNCMVKFLMPLKLTGNQNIRTVLTTGQSAQIDGTANFNDSGFIYVEGWDSLVGKDNDRGQPNSQIPMLVGISGSGSVSAASGLTVHFGDQFGTLDVTGQIRGTQIDGQIRFNNTSTKVGGPVSGTVPFQTAVCNVFLCQ